jgi:kumamolisin
MGTRRMGKLKKQWLLLTAGALMMTTLPTAVFAASPNQEIKQGLGAAVLDGSNFFGDLDPSTQVTIDIVMKVQNKDALTTYINETVTPGNAHYRKYLSVNDFKAKYAPQSSQIKAITDFLSSFGIKSTVYPDNLVITATGTVAQLNKAFNVELQEASYKGKKYHGTKKNPQAPAAVANNILCILGLSDYSNLTSRTAKLPDDLSPNQTSKAQAAPYGQMPSDLISRYNVQPLYDKGAAGAGQTIGIVTLADFNVSDAYAFWKYNNINVKSNRLTKINVDGGSGLSEDTGSDETTLDVQQSGALAPQADMRVYVGPNSDTGFVDSFAKAINDNVAQQISVSWGESEAIIDAFVQMQLETPEYAETFNQLYMQAAVQGISMFAAAGDSGAYDASRDLGSYNVGVDNPGDSPYITSAGGTTVPFTYNAPQYNLSITVPQERAWGWDYLYPLFDAKGMNNPDGWASRYFVGGGGGFSSIFATPDYQKGVPGVNTYKAVKQWTASADGYSVTRDASPTIVSGTGTGRNVPDLSMNADPYTGYSVYVNLPVSDGSSDIDSGWVRYGGTSFVSPQLAGLSALINSADKTRVGFWNPQLYRFATQSNSPLHPLNTADASNDNVFYAGQPGTVYNQASGLGTPDVTALAARFAGK